MLIDTLTLQKAQWDLGKFLKRSDFQNCWNRGWPTLIPQHSAAAVASVQPSRAPPAQNSLFCLLYVEPPGFNVGGPDAEWHHDACECWQEGVLSRWVIQAQCSSKVKHLPFVAVGDSRRSLSVAASLNCSRQGVETILHNLYSGKQQCL